MNHARLLLPVMSTSFLIGLGCLKTGDAAAQSIAAGTTHLLALCGDGTVNAWGLNASGRLGNGTTTDNWTPTAVSGMTNIIAVAAGNSHSIALDQDGTVWSWGANGSGQLGDGTTSDRPEPVQVFGLSGIIAIQAGGVHSLALSNDGTVWAWGLNSWGQLGDGTTTDRWEPVQVLGLTGITAVSGGGAHSLALRDDGTAWAWGWNAWRQIGDGSTVSHRTQPVQVTDLTGCIAVAAGYDHSLALKDDGTVWAWGGNGAGQLGNGTSGAGPGCQCGGQNCCEPLPVQVMELSGVTALAAEHWTSIALKNDGTAWAWGFNGGGGQLGNGSVISSSTPIAVTGIDGITGVMAIAARYGVSIALKIDGTVWTWGWTPVQVAGLCSIAVVVAEYDDNISLTATPNPFTSTVSISIGSRTSGAVSCTVRSLTGQVLASRTIADGRSSFTLDLASLAPGAYLLEVMLDGERIVKKVMKE